MNLKFYYSVKQKLHILGELEENKEMCSLRDKNPEEPKYEIG